jgi:hypothetical protein
MTTILTQRGRDAEGKKIRRKERRLGRTGREAANQKVKNMPPVSQC